MLTPEQSEFLKFLAHPTNRIGVWRLRATDDVERAACRVVGGTVDESGTMIFRGSFRGRSRVTVIEQLAQFYQVLNVARVGKS